MADVVPSFIAPMLVHSMPSRDRVDIYAASSVMEEKFDGERVIVCVLQHRAVEAWSRPGQGRSPLRKAIAPAVEASLKRLPTGVYDGELVPWRVREVVGRRTVPSRARVVLFDVLSVLNQSLVRDVAWSERRMLLELAYDATDRPDNLRLTQVLPVSQSEVDRIWAAGGEGAILKRRDSLYVPGARVWSWLKVKKFRHTVVEIRGWKAGKAGPRAVAQCWSPEFNVAVNVTAHWHKMPGSDPDAYLGSLVQVEFTDLTSSGRLREPRFDHLVDGAKISGYEQAPVCEMRRAVDPVGGALP